MNSALILHSLTCGRTGTPLDAETLALLCCEVQMLAVDRMSPCQRWDWLEAGLMSPHPAAFIESLRASTALSRLLPEVAALFGVPQLSDASTPIDIGTHQLKVQTEAARCRAPVAVRFAALVHEIGKGRTPALLWPSHYRNDIEGVQLLRHIEERIALPPDVADLSALVIADADRVHRASHRRAGPITLLLTRWQALERPERFEHLLQVCTCDYAAYDGHSAQTYPKAPLMRQALQAMRGVSRPGLDDDGLLELRAHAVAAALSSLTFEPGD